MDLATETGKKDLIMKEVFFPPNKRIGLVPTLYHAYKIRVARNDSILQRQMCFGRNTLIAILTNPQVLLQEPFYFLPGGFTEPIIVILINTFRGVM